MATKQDYYDLLGCSRDASADDLRRAYKREALKHHPDRNQGDTKAEGRFKEINEAYQVLSDDRKRQIYDQFGHAGLEGGAADAGDVFAHMQDLFSEMFSGGGFGQSRQRRGGDLRVQVRLTLREAAFGAKKEITVRAPSPCGECSGSGVASGSKPESCAQCRGSGQVSSARGFVMFSAPCPRCQGRGAIVKNPCKACEGQGAVERTRKVTVSFPAGIDAGQRLRVPGQGMGIANGPSGDLFVEVDVEDDPRFERDGADLVTRAHVTFAEATLGGKIAVPSLSDKGDSTMQIDLPEGTQSGAVFSLKGQGIPRLDGRGRGALVVVIQVDVPTAVSARARELLLELDAELASESRAAPSKGSQRKAAASK